MKEYKVEFIQTETFFVDCIMAKSEKEAIDIAQEIFNSGNYQETGDCNVEIGKVTYMDDNDRLLCVEEGCKALQTADGEYCDKHYPTEKGENKCQVLTCDNMATHNLCESCINT